MKDKKLKIGISEIKQISMTDVEKKRIFDNVLNSVNTPKPIHSPWSFSSLYFSVSRTKMAYYIIVPLIFILSGSGIVFASQDSLPDSILYPIKVNVVEPVVGVLSLSKKSKAIYESGLARKRLVEAETLASEGKLDVAKEEKINNLLTKHTVALNNALDQVNNEGQSEEADVITTDFRAEMNAHAKVLDILTKRESRDRKNKEEGIPVVGGAEISNVARVSADNVKNNTNSKEKNSFKKFKNKKQEVQSLIDSAVTNVDSNSINNETEKDTVASDAQKTIDQAKAYLDNADKKDKEGNSSEAYSSLLDSESSVKEAKILLKESLKINKNRDKNSNDNSEDNRD